MPSGSGFGSMGGFGTDFGNDFGGFDDGKKYGWDL
jgi:hypothetical protein